MVTALVIEDSQTDRTQLTQYLQKLGISVVGVSSSEDALLRIQLTQPDVVFLDIILPGQRGIEFCRYLKSNENTQNIPVILYSTKHTEADRLWGSMLGADAYLSKPIDLQQIDKALQQVIH